MQVYIKGFEGKTITIVIEPTSTVLDLKKKYYERTSIELQHQRLLFDGKQLEDNYTLEFYKIGNGSTIDLVVRLHGGGGFGFQMFQDLTKPTILKPWGDAPDWRMAVRGLSLEGYCKNNSCKASNCKVLVRWGYRDFNFIEEEHESRCPMCGQYVTPISCGFNNTFWKFKGLKKVHGERPEEVDSDWRFAPNTGFTTYASEDLVIWKELVIQVKRP